MIDGKSFFDQTLEVILQHMITFKELRQVKEVIAQWLFGGL